MGELKTKLQLGYNAFFISKLNAVTPSFKK